MIKIISLGAGVQSTTMALMAMTGEIDKPDCAIFADTGWEPEAVYIHLENLIKVLDYPVYIVSEGNIKQDILEKHRNGNTKRLAAVPWHLKKQSEIIDYDSFDKPKVVGYTEVAAMGRRQCTKDYKLVPLRRKVRELLGDKVWNGACEMWIGITTDEASRMKDSTVKYIVNRWPLIEMRLSRADCLHWLAQAGWQVPKSSCIGCPYHNDNQWREIKRNPVAWQDAVEVDKAIRNGGSSGIKAQQFMHRSLQPLDEVDLRNAEDFGQINMFENECEGMCGV